jgi:AraC-like DNA-binding protein
MTTHFNTSAVPEPERFEFWQDVICRTYVSVNCTVLNADFDAEVAVHPFGAGLLTDVSSSAMGYARTSDDVRRSPSDELQLCLIEKGGLAVEQGGRQAVLGPGDIGLYDNARPFSLLFGEQYKALILKLPRPVLAARIPDIDKMTASRFPGDSRLGALANSVMRESARLGSSADERLTARVSGSVVDILAVALENELLGHQASNSRQLAQIERIKHYMLDRLGDSDLDIEGIAADCHVAPRTIHRLFATEGTTTIRWLWQQRLAASYRALAEGHVKQVSEAAINCGFSDFSHFTRAFKKAYGIAPHSLLRKGH